MATMTLGSAFRCITHYFAPITVTGRWVSISTINIELTDPDSTEHMVLTAIPCAALISTTALDLLINLIESQMQAHQSDLFAIHAANQLNRRPRP